ncbi:tyrosine-protein kinase receptor torso-like isoform X2 [Onthophagus taurus]|uniref:tyrosine-protein kinase receptor torso-like isoform X2 n=1 Tax=Onthophagus taurus TaxID=166361 RepID=UPI000C20619F|nr:tyrosine-protein kinase receptor torso-like [Onthophagus taurus]
MLQVQDSVDIYKSDKEFLFLEQYNLSVVINYNQSMNCLQFQFTSDVSSDENLTATIISFPSSNPHVVCDDFNFDLVTNINEPISFLGEANQLNFGCTYNITVNDRFTSLSFNYSIPYCVDGKCNCDTHLVPMNMTMDYQGRDEFLIRWKFTNVEDRDTLVNVTFYSYVSDDCSDPPDWNNITEPKHKLFMWNNSALIYIEDNPHLCLLTTFKNKYTCEEAFLRSLKINNSTWINISYTFISVILLLVIVALWYIHKCRGTIKTVLITRDQSRRRRSCHNIYGYFPDKKKWAESTNIEYIEHEILEGLVDEFELPRNHLKLLNEIGKGAFGEVYLGNIILNGNNESVAVKTLRERCSNEEMEDFLSEIDIMKKIGRHRNIVTMLKCCTLQEPYRMIMEYVPYGDLKHYLMSMRDKWIKKNNFDDDESESYIVPITPTNKFTLDIAQDTILDHTELQDFALQIACGMAHLEKIPITHRDLAARNILIDANKILKISDFGLSRPGPYINKNHNKLPFRWMALEAIEDHFYNNKSDVWSFGVVLWEIGTLGAFPYDTIPDRMLLYHLHIGKRLERPEICTDELYSLMLRCWSEDPKFRPTFEELVEELDVKKSRIYIDFTQLNPSYVFPPIRANEYHKVETT